jgi:glycerol-3-phosphate dehydrogenase
LAASDERKKSTKEISRHKIIVSETGLITITGGKWTTYRKIAEDLVDKEGIECTHLSKINVKQTHFYSRKQKNKRNRLGNHLYIYGTDILK